MSRILWLGDAGSHTGFGTVTHNIGERLIRDYGHDIHVLAVNYKGDHVDTDLKLYLPTKLHQLDAYGQSRIVELLAELLPDVVIMLNDPWVIRKIQLNNNWDTPRILARYRSYITDGDPIVPLDDDVIDDPVRFIKHLGKFPPSTITYMPIDGTNSPPLWQDIALMTQPVIMSDWGKTVFPDARVIYHGVDTELFRPAAERSYISSSGVLVDDKISAKRALGLDPDHFLVVRVDRNSERKNYGDTWKALVPFVRAHDDVQVYFHCKPSGDYLELPQLFSREPDVASRFHTPERLDTAHGISVEDLAILYNAADVFVSTSWAEGFGLTLAEALACGTPVVAQDCSSITEVVGPGGVLIPPAGLITAPAGQDQWLPDVPAFTAAIESLYADPQKREALGRAGHAHVKETYSWDVAAKQFDALIGEVIERGGRYVERSQRTAVRES